MKLLSGLVLALCILVACNGAKKQHDNVKKESEEISDLISYWDQQRKGTNQFNKYPSVEWFEAAAEADIRFVRLTYGKWKSKHRDFLIGNADNYTGLIDEDFEKLKNTLDVADSLGIKIVLSPLSLPGARYRQFNNMVRDGRLWTDSTYLPQAKQFWIDLASRLNNHPAIVGYNLVNEPYPEWFNGKKSFWEKGFTEWFETIKNTPADLNKFNRVMVEAIRTVDQETPIIVESGLWATPWTFEYLKPVADDKIIYSFHMYEPYDFSTFKLNPDKYHYPGEMPLTANDTVFQLNKSSLSKFLNPLKDWSEKYNIPANRIWAAEFGCARRITGAEKYLGDLIEIFNEHQWHWSFYSFREDVWESMDYELGNQKVPWKYYDYSGKESFHKHYNEIYNNVKENQIWPVFEKEFLSTK
jgi:hypothetical protein